MFCTIDRLETEGRNILITQCAAIIAFDAQVDQRTVSRQVYVQVNIRYFLCAATGDTAVSQVRHTTIIHGCPMRPHT
jgi:hypothetical protein